MRRSPNPPGGIFGIGLFQRSKCQQNWQHFSRKQLPLVKFSMAKLQLISGQALVKYGRNEG
jgi:hypothetical protein